MQSPLKTPDSPSAQTPGSGSTTPSQEEQTGIPTTREAQFCVLGPEGPTRSFFELAPQRTPRCSIDQLDPAFAQYHAVLYHDD